MLDSSRRNGRELAGDLNTVAGFDQIESRNVVPGYQDHSQTRLAGAIVAGAPTASDLDVIGTDRPKAAEEGREGQA